jgi:hypothetical protein
VKALACLTALAVVSARATAQEPVQAASQASRQSLTDAWWTGPLLAASPNALPPGHWLIEPYLYDVMSDHTHGFGSLTYILYGLLPRFTVGVIPTFGFNKVNGGLSSTRIGVGDLTAVAQYRLTLFHEGSLVPTTAIVVRQVFPTGKYDDLGDRPSDGLGAGAYTTELALYSQEFFWMPNGRILRVRFDATQSVSGAVTLNGVSVYGTGPDFHGSAKPGPSTSLDAAAEYSITRRWVFACDVGYGFNANTPVTGYNLRLNSGSSTPLAFAPAIEYNWSPRYGVILGTRIIPAMRNTTPSVTPAVAVNMVL